MKHIKFLSVLFMALSCTCSVFAQSKSELKEEIEQLKQQNQQNQQMMQMMMMQMQQNQNNQQYQQYPQQQYPQQQYPQQGYQQQYPQQGYQAGGYNNGSAGDGYSGEIQQTRIEALQFANHDKLRAVGKAESRDEAFARDIAEQNARAQMQRQIETFTKDGLQRYRKQSAMDDAEKYMANDEQLSSSVSKGILNGCKVIDQAKYYNRSTKKYKYEVLVEYDKAGVMSLIESQDAEIRRNKAQFEKEMQNIFDEYEMEKTGSTYAMKKQAAQDAMDDAKADRQAAREARAKQQDADNAYRQNQQEADNNFRRQQSNQQYNLQSQKQAQDTATKMQQQKIDGEILKGNSRDQRIEY